jgi:endonuclease/exonuclease/phosphatase family metal-dependent hydrolase
MVLLALQWVPCSKLAGQAAVHSSRVVRVLSYNILHGETLKGDFDLDLIASVISQENPDLVALQEVDFRTRRALDMDLVSELGERTALVPLFGRAMYYDGGEYGEGILSRYTFLSSRNHPLPAGEGKEPRAALEVRVQLPCGDTIAFIGTHFDHTGDVDRINQALELREIIAGLNMPVILAGDLNARPESRPMEILFEDLEPSSGDMAPTIPSDNPRSKIDYVLYGPPERWRVLESRVICDSIASDHCAQFSVLELLPAVH